MTSQNIASINDAPISLDNYNQDQVSAVAVKAYSRIAAAWKLNNQIASELIAVSPRTWARIKNDNWTGKLKRDQLMRISALVGLYKALHLYFSDELADQWPGLRNTGPMFSGRSPQDAMVEEGLPFMLETRNYVDALRGGA